MSSTLTQDGIWSERVVDVTVDFANDLIFTSTISSKQFDEKRVENY